MGDSRLYYTSEPMPFVVDKKAIKIQRGERTKKQKQNKKNSA